MQIQPLFPTPTAILVQATITSDDENSPLTWLPKPAPGPLQSPHSSQSEEKSDHVRLLLRPFQRLPRLHTAEDKPLTMATRQAVCPPHLSTCICPYAPPCSLGSNPTGFLSGANLYQALLGSGWALCKSFTRPISMNSNESPTRWVIRLSSFCRGGNQGLERSSHGGGTSEAHTYLWPPTPFQKRRPTKSQT